MPKFNISLSPERNEGQNLEDMCHGIESIVNVDNQDAAEALADLAIKKWVSEGKDIPCFKHPEANEMFEAKRFFINRII